MIMQDQPPVNLPTTVALILAFLLFVYNQWTSKNSNLPPGPRRWPFIGNVLQLPQVNPWFTFREWAKTYGNLVYVEVFGQPMVIINTVAAAREILDKHSSTSSNRPHLVMASELIGFSETFALQQYNDDWRQQRKLVAQEFSAGVVPKYHDMQEKQARLLVQNLVKDSSTFVSEIKLRIGILIMRVTYGIHLKSAEDRFLQLPLTAMENFSYATVPGNFLVDFFPILKYVPSWVPGAGFKKIATEWRKDFLAATWEPYRWSKKGLDNGEVLLPNLCSSIISEAGGTVPNDLDRTLALAASSVMGGGMDTNMSTALSFFLLMLQYPEAQKKARAEIDAVVGLDRLPTISDRASLPYVRSLFTEVLRLHPSVPLGIPHALSQDEIFEGLHLPKGSILIPNVWNMVHDPEVYDKPMEFIPERYNNSDAEMTKVTNLVFGFGRRVCPGSSFAQGTLYAIILTVLATCEILPPLDKSGKAVIPQVSYTSGTIVFPGTFEIRLKYRSKKAMELLSETPTQAE